MSFLRGFSLVEESFPLTAEVDNIPQRYSGAVAITFDQKESAFNQSHGKGVFEFSKAQLFHKKKKLCQDAHIAK